MAKKRPSREAEALERVRQYLAAWDARPIRGLHDEIHSLHTGSDFEGVLRLSDLRVVVAMLESHES